MRRGNEWDVGEWTNERKVRMSCHHFSFLGSPYKAHYVRIEYSYLAGL